MRPDEREVVERAIHRVTEHVANPNAIVDEAIAAGLDASASSSGAIRSTARRTK